MRFLEFSKGPSTFITNEEQDLLQQIINKGVVYKKKLSEREAELANRLVNKDLLLRKRIDDQITYQRSSKSKSQKSY
jgi:hypothetical protein